ncbi:MAG: LysR substrate-binding domain-containing protein, partial [Anaerotignaceae bacterium]
PTLSKFLISIENNLGQRLFRKMGNKYILTYAGERYVEKANEILQIKNNLDIELADIMKNDIGVLNVAFPHMRCTYMLSKTLPEFQKMHPKVKVNVLEGNSGENDKRILDGQAEISFSTKPTDINPLIEYETLCKEEMLICTCKNHPLKHFSQPNPASKYPKLDAALLKNELVLRPMPDQRTRQITDDYFHEHNLSFPNVMYTSSLPAIMELVAVGYGVSFIFETHLRHRVATEPIDCYSFGNPKTLSDFVVAYRKGSYLPSYARDFIEVARHIFY